MAGTLLDLPLELRYMVYEHIFPPRIITEPAKHTAARKGFLSLLRASRSLHDEVAAAYYGTGTFQIIATGQVSSQIDAYGNARFQGTTIRYQDIHNDPRLTALDRIKHLQVSVHSGNQDRFICEAQTVLLHLVKRLNRSSPLISLTFKLEQLWLSGLKPETEIIMIGRYYDFLLEPLRHLLLQTPVQLRQLKLSVTRKDDVPRNSFVGGLLAGSSETRLLDCWVRYFAVLAQVIRLEASSHRQPCLEFAMHRYLHGVSQARIHDDLKTLEVWHVAIITRARSRAAYATPWGALDNRESRAQKEALLKRMGALEAALIDLRAAMADRVSSGSEARSAPEAHGDEESEDW